MPWGSHGPRQTQQNSVLQCWFLQTMWLQPPSFSMVTLHFGHSFVLAAIQFDVSESSSHFFIHFFSQWHFTGSCQFSPQWKQNVCEHLQVTGFDSTYWTFIALLQSGDGHHLNSLLHWKIIEKKKQNSTKKHNKILEIDPGFLKFAFSKPRSLLSYKI